MTTLDDQLFQEESSHVEWKESHEAKDLLDAVCAFANDLADSKRTGIILVGVDKNGVPTGRYQHGPEADKVQQQLATTLSSTKILPHPVVTVETRERDGHLVFLVRVEAYHVPPIVKVNGTAWVRIGTVTRRASESDIRRLEERRPIHHQPFDTRPCDGATLEDLNRELLADKYRAARELDGDPETFHSFEQWLTQKDLGAATPSGWTPNNAAMLVYGLSPQSFFPGAFVDIVRYGGTDWDAPILVRKTVQGALPDQLASAWTVLGTLNLDVAHGESGIQAAFAPMYPTDVLRELVRNLVQHRDYAAVRAPGRIAWFEDHIELSNPGAPYGQASIGRLGEHSEYRNPRITQLLLDQGYVERAGRGIRRAEALLRKGGHPPLEVEKNGYTTIIVRSPTA
ncbi:MAG: putative DNA binding domain-containing protein [Nannocystis sp.]|nr:RNA-binding domain-containing protein [Nannocystis sp.]MBA3547069.1 putative DNA binding domain-containing protein [Nannocystis sp.]